MADELKVPLGVREDGSIIHITEVPIEENGLKCKCVCPKCGDRLQARNAGKVRQHYFAHDKHHSCEGATESALHLFAKEVFSRHSSIRVPPDEVWVDYLTRDIPAMTVPFLGAAMEQRFDEADIIADVVLHRANDKPPVLVEIAVTHFVDDEKHVKLRKLGYPCIEVDLSEMRIGLAEFDRETIEDTLINGEDLKRWLCNPYGRRLRAELAEQLRLEAEQEAEQKRKREERKTRAREHSRRQRERVMNPEYQKAMAERTEQELATNPIWAANRRAFGMNDSDETPWYLNVELNGEYLWTVHRTVWQSALFRSWVFNKAGSERSPFVSVKFAVDHLHDTHKNIWENALYWAWQDTGAVRSPSSVIAEYLAVLAECGFLEDEQTWGMPYSWAFNCVLPKFLPMPPEYNNPRFLPREGGVFDTDSGQDIKF